MFAEAEAFFSPVILFLSLHLGTVWGARTCCFYLPVPRTQHQAWHYLSNKDLYLRTSFSGHAGPCKLNDRRLAVMIHWPEPSPEVLCPWGMSDCGYGPFQWSQPRGGCWCWHPLGRGQGCCLMSFHVQDSPPSKESSCPKRQWHRPRDPVLEKRSFFFFFVLFLRPVANILWVPMCISGIWGFLIR